MLCIKVSTTVITFFNCPLFEVMKTVGHPSLHIISYLLSIHPIHFESCVFYIQSDRLTV